MSHTPALLPDGTVIQETQMSVEQLASLRNDGSISLRTGDNQSSKALKLDETIPCRIAESLILRFPIPAIVFSQKGDNRYIEYGASFLTHLFWYIDPPLIGKVNLPDSIYMQFSHEGNGKDFLQLSDKLQARITEARISVITIQRDERVCDHNFRISNNDVVRNIVRRVSGRFDYQELDI